MNEQMKIAVITGSRADYGLLQPTLAALNSDPRFELQLFATAMHLDEAYGMTVNEIKFPFTRVPISLDALKPRFGNAVVVLTRALAMSKPDLLLVFGDRFEMLAAALAATEMGIPIAHMYGGELSEGSLDDAYRHCITKLSHLHFVAIEQYAKRVRQLGEEPWRIHIVGAAAIETIKDFHPSELGIGHPLVALVLHPTSLLPEQAQTEARTVTTAIDKVLNHGTVVVVLPNDDPGSQATREVIMRWASRALPHVHVHPSISQQNYLNVLAHADVLIGNSSSALSEAPSFELPAVNVGDRQRGRVTPANVISCPMAETQIIAALEQALDPGFRASLSGMENPWGDGTMSNRILAVLANADMQRLRDKRFIDIETR